MTFSLILCTVDRTSEVGRFLQSLVRQHRPDVEVILVDQNDDDRLVPIVERFGEQITIRHVRSVLGLSRARNVGLSMIEGGLVGFPDDDCWYPDGLLDQVAKAFERDARLDGVTGRFTDERGTAEGRWLANDVDLDAFNVWRGAISFSIFLRRHVVDRVGSFDETLGVGSGTAWGAAEETDYLLRSIEAGFRIRFIRELVLGHPVKSTSFDEVARLRHQKYEAGIGRVIRMHRYPVWYFPLTCARTFCGATIALATGDLGRARFKASALRGRLTGWLGPPT